MITKRAHVALRIALVALVLIFVIVCGAHLGGLSHDGAGGLHSIATAIVIAFAVALVLRAAATRHHVQVGQSTREPGAPVASRTPTGRVPGILTPLRC